MTTNQGTAGQGVDQGQGASAEPTDLVLLLADSRQALFDSVASDEGAGVALRYEIGRAIGLMGRAMDELGCPVCNGDCSGANPPMTSCPMSKIGGEA